MHNYQESPYVVYFIILIIFLVFIFCVIFAGLENQSRCGGRSCSVSRDHKKKGGRNNGGIALGVTFIFLIFIIAFWWNVSR